MGVPKKITVEFYVAQSTPPQPRKLLYRYLLTGFVSLDDAREQARARAHNDRRKVVSMNFRQPQPDEPVDTLIVYLAESPT